MTADGQDQGQVEGIITTDQSGFFAVELDDGRQIICRLRGRLMEAAQASDIAAVGDRVRISIADDGSGAIESVAPRTSVVSRAVRTTGARGAGASEREHVIVANADQMLIVVAAAEPAPNLRLIDRFLVAAEKSAIERTIIIVNKIDLATDGDDLRRRFGLYERIGYTVLYTCAVSGEGVEDMRALLEGRLSVFTGPSGVGKSSLLNRVQPELGRAVRAVSGYNQEGTHTTRDSALFKLVNGGYIADTPGIRNLAIWDVEPEELDAYFREIAAHIVNCRFGDCAHRDEPGCAVRQAVEAGQIARGRYRSYLALRDELEAAYAL